MNVIFGIILLFSTIYFFSLVFFLYGLYKAQSPNSTDKPFVSIVIAVKNEASNILQLLDCLVQQDYTENLFEILIVDNESDDHTYELIGSKAREFPLIQLLSTKDCCSKYQYKKAAMSLGIEKAQGEIILSTDADCRMGPQWVSTVAGYFSREIGMVVGFSGVQYSRSIFSRFQALDFLQLMAGAQGTLNLGTAWGCSGQNLAFRKSIYKAAGGYEEIAGRVGGDDALFMQLVKNKTNTGIVFASDKKAWITNKPVDRIYDFMLQRARWASEANYMHNLNPVLFVIIVSTFIANLAPPVYLALGFLHITSFFPLLFLVIMKLVGEGALLLKATAVYNRRNLRRSFFFWFFLQPLYIMIIGVLSFIGNQFGWKRRSG